MFYHGCISLVLHRRHYVIVVTLICYVRATIHVRLVQGREGGSILVTPLLGNSYLSCQIIEVIYS